MFTLNGINYDDYVVLKKYKINRAPEYGGTEYRDGWWKRHRTIVRHSINGSITLAFPNAETYNDFIDNVAESMGPDGDYLIKVYVQETNSIEEIRAFLTPTARTAIATKPYGYAPVFFNVTLKVEER